MKINQLSLSFTSDEIARALKTAIERASATNTQLPPELADLGIEIKNGQLVISTKKKLGFMPVTISASLELCPAVNLDGITIRLAKISAGFVGSEAIAAQVLSQIGRSLTGVPGCTVDGNNITLTKDALAAKVPWLSVPGKVNRFGIEGDTLEIAIG